MAKALNLSKEEMKLRRAASAKAWRDRKHNVETLRAAAAYLEQQNGD